jgi:hypothetical protein
MKMITRSENGKLKLNALDAEIFFSDLMYMANNANELDFIKDNLVGIIENMYDERFEELA